VNTWRRAAWPVAVDEFTAVVPRDYQHAIRVIRAARARGHDIDETLMAELAGARA